LILGLRGYTFMDEDDYDVEQAPFTGRRRIMSKQYDLGEWGYSSCVGGSFTNLPCALTSGGQSDFYSYPSWLYTLDVEFDRNLAGRIYQESEAKEEKPAPKFELIKYEVTPQVGHTIAELLRCMC
jgi:hypothetical protein